MMWSAKTILRPVLFVCIVDLITTIFFLLKISKYIWIQKHFLPIGFLITGIFLYSSKYIYKTKKDDWLLRDAFILGGAQAISLLPGISRFACTYVVGLWLGYEKKTAFAISFLIQLPLLCAAFVKGFLAVLKHPDILIDITQNWVMFIIILASVISYFVFCLIGRLIEKNKLNKQIF